MLPIDPDADRGRRAWLPCPWCHHEAGCAVCRAGRNCDVHWQYLLSNQATLVHLQCPTCGQVWMTDTRRHRVSKDCAMRQGRHDDESAAPSNDLRVNVVRHRPGRGEDHR
jgi:ribosomal protein L32